MENNNYNSDFNNFQVPQQPLIDQSNLIDEFDLQSSEPSLLRNGYLNNSNYPQYVPVNNESSSSSSIYPRYAGDSVVVGVGRNVEQDNVNRPCASCNPRVNLIN